jgi:branched-chain amino acid transport system substrate-binding protein
LAKVKASKPDGVYLPGYYAEIGPLLRQAKELGLKVQFISCVGFDNPKVLELAGNAAEEVVFARPYYNPGGQDPKVKGFVERFKAKYGIEPGVYAAHAYDAASILLQIVRSGARTADAIKGALYATKDFPGVTGSTSFDSNGDVIKPIQIMTVEKGAFVTAK